MPLNQPTLKQAIEAAFLEARKKESQPEQAIGALADAIALAIDTYVKAGVVNSTGTCPTGAVAAIGSMT